MEEVKEVVTETPAEQEVLAQVVKYEDGYHVIDKDGTVGPVCTKVSVDGYVILSPNAANRKCINKNKADKFFEENPDGSIPLYYKATRDSSTFKSHKDSTLNAKLIAFLSDEQKAEYDAIIEAAKAKREVAYTEYNSEKNKIVRELAVLEYKLALAKGENAEQPEFEKVSNNLVDHIPDEMYDRYKELLDIAEAAKATAPKPERAKTERKPLTKEQQIEKVKKEMAKKQELLAQLMAEMNIG